MSEPVDIDALAAEFVLGTLDADERAAVIARRARDAALDQAIVDWERRLGPLALALPPITPPRDLLPDIERRLDGIDRMAVAERTASSPSAATDKSAAMWQRRRWLELGALAAVAAVVALLVFVPPLLTPPAVQHVATLTAKDNTPAFVLKADLARGVLSVRQITRAADPGKAYELWIIEPSLGAPRTLGVIPQGGYNGRLLLAAFDRKIAERATYAVSLEPAGGSPSGAPTGPVLFTGTLAEVAG